MATRGRAAPPLPPLALAHRVGALDGEDDPFELYERVGRDTRSRILKMLPAGALPGGGRVLDFGCGAGRTLRHFLDEAEKSEIWGCDIDTPSVAWIEANLCPPLRAFRNEELPPLPFEEGSLDLIWALSVFTHLTDTWAAWLAELHRVLVPGGILIATTLGPHHSQSFTGEPWDEDTTGMNVLRHWAGWDIGGPVVLHSEWWLRAHWGRGFDVVEVKVVPVEGALSNHRWLSLRKRGKGITTEELEAPELSEPREIEALRRNVRQLQREYDARAAELEREYARAARTAERTATARYETPLAKSEARVEALEHELARVAALYESTLSWRITAPLRVLRAGAVRRR